jgi:hypothetical protein
MFYAMDFLIKDFGDTKPHDKRRINFAYSWI